MYYIHISFVHTQILYYNHIIISLYHLRVLISSPLFAFFFRYILSFMSQQIADVLEARASISPAAFTRALRCSVGVSDTRLAALVQDYSAMLANRIC